MEYILTYELEVIPEYNGMVDCIYKISLEYEGKDGEFSTKDFSSFILPLPEGNSFIPFDQLTDEKIREWIFRIYPKDAIEKNLADRIFIMKNPTVIKSLVG